MKVNPVKDKSYAFALRVVKLYRYLCEERKEYVLSKQLLRSGTEEIVVDELEQFQYVLSKQLLRSGTSIGANIEEGLAGQSTRDFIAKFQISLKEAKESHYWLRLLRDSELLDAKMSESFLADCNELISLLTKILKSTKCA